MATILDPNTPEFAEKYKTIHWTEKPLRLILADKYECARQLDKKWDEISKRWYYNPATFAHLCLNLVPDTYSPMTWLDITEQLFSKEAKLEFGDRRYELRGGIQTMDGASEGLYAAAYMQTITQCLASFAGLCNIHDGIYVLANRYNAWEDLQRSELWLQYSTLHREIDALASIYGRQLMTLTAVLATAWGCSGRGTPYVDALDYIKGMISEDDARKKSGSVCKMNLG